MYCQMFFFLFAILSLNLFIVQANGQEAATRARRVTTISPEPTELESEEVTPLLPTSIESELQPSSPITSEQFEKLLSSAIYTRLGARYSFGAEGPNRFDCSGFVWRVFQSAGVDFDRDSARKLWRQFPAPKAEDRYKFGTLVFFNNLNHIGIVADEKGFYHASTTKGVVYSEFDKYWKRRLNGFRRIPIQASLPDLEIAKAGSADAPIRAMVSSTLEPKVRPVSKIRFRQPESTAAKKRSEEAGKSTETKTKADSGSFTF
jgi:hypothetical protein